MNIDTTPGLFEIKLSEDGIRYIRKLSRIVKFVIIIGVLISAFSITTGIYYKLSSKFDYSSLSFWQGLYFRLFPFYLCFHAILFLVQIYFYWKVSQQLNVAITYKNEISFNQSFRYLYKNAVWAIITMAMAFVFSALDLLYVLTIAI